MAIHGIASSYFGDKEWDIGKSVRWFQLFCDTEYILDANLNRRPRAFLIAWEASFPGVKYSYFTANAFTKDPETAATWRKTSFERADAAWGYDADDWVVFVDTTEALVVDDNYPPDGLGDNYSDTVDPFKGYITQEIANVAPGVEVIYLPFWAFVRNSAPFRVYGTVDPTLDGVIENLLPGQTYQGLTASELRQMNRTEHISAYSFYTHPGYLPRLFKVSALRDPGFDWTTLDTFVAVEDIPAEAAKTELALSLVSYAYARWSQDPTAVDPATGMPATEADDDGYRMRRYISRVRPIDGLPTDAWPPVDTAPLYAPVLPDGLQPQDDSVLTEEFPEFSSDFSDAMLNFYRRAVEQPSEPWPAEHFELTSPIYPTIIRQNIREGLFFESDEFGPVPWNYVTGQPGLDPEIWNNLTLPSLGEVHTTR